VDSVRRFALTEALAATALIMALAAGNHLLPGVWSTGSGIIAALVMLWLPVLVIHYRKRDFHAYGLTGARWWSDVKIGTCMAVLVLPPFAFGYWLFWGAIVGHEMAWRIDAQVAWQLLHQLAAVALPEEVFFRGYLLTLLHRVWPGKQRAWVGAYGPAVLLSSALFALAHALPQWQPLRLTVFFPALLFAYLRVRTGSVTAAIVLHGLANVAVFVIAGKL